MLNHLQALKTFWIDRKGELKEAVGFDLLWRAFLKEHPLAAEATSEERGVNFYKHGIEFLRRMAIEGKIPQGSGGEFVCEWALRLTLEDGTPRFVVNGEAYTQMLIQEIEYLNSWNK